MPSPLEKLAKRILTSLAYRTIRHRLVPVALDPQHNAFDRAVAQYISSHPRAFVLQIGANDGVAYDPVRHHIVRHRLPGLLVEPQPGPYSNLVKNYSGQDQLCFENSLIAAADGNCKFFSVEEGDSERLHLTGLASFDKDIILRHRDKCPEIESLIVETQFPALSFDSLLRKHDVKYVDILVIDAEGYDYELLKLFDLEKRQPEIVLFEHSHFSFDYRWECLNFLVDSGYSFDVIGEDILARKIPGAIRTKLVEDQETD